MFNIGMTEMLIIGAIALLVLGPAKMPEVARTLGKGLRSVRKATNELKTAFHEEVEKVKPAEIKEISNLTHELGQRTSRPESIEEYLETAANVLESSAKKDSKSQDTKNS